MTLENFKALHSTAIADGFVIVAVRDLPPEITTSTVVDSIYSAGVSFGIWRRGFRRCLLAEMGYMRCIEQFRKRRTRHVLRITPAGIVTLIAGPGTLGISTAETRRHEADSWLDHQAEPLQDRYRKVILEIAASVSPLIAKEVADRVGVPFETLRGWLPKLRRYGVKLHSSGQGYIWKQPPSA